jgi:NTE family protein
MMTESIDKKITLRKWLQQEPFSLGLSAGFFGFFAHAGMVSVLEEEGFCPIKLVGSSAGALVGSLWAAGVAANDIHQELLSLQRNDFWDPGFGLGLLRGKLLRKKLEQMYPVKSFSDCPIKLAISVFDIFTWSTKVLDEGLLAPAVHAACAVPGLLHPVWLGGRPYLDGGLGDRHGLSGIAPKTRLLYHHLSSCSPWRSVNSLAMQVPERQNMVSLVIDDIPRSGPFKLNEGRRAFLAVQDATRRALDRQIVNGKIEI